LPAIIRLTADDWGWYMTVRGTIDKCLQLSDTYLAGAEKENVVGKLQQIKQAMEASAKTLRWKMRAQVGERVRWYELPEEVAR